MVFHNTHLIMKTSSKIVRFVKKVIIWFFILSIISVVIFRWIPIPFHSAYADKVFRTKSDGKENEIEKGLGIT